MIQKILSVGSSIAITIPKEVRESLHLKAGKFVHTDFDKKNGVFSISQETKLSREDEEILRHAAGFMKRYEKDLKALAK